MTIWFSASCSLTILPNSLGLAALPLRMISVDGSNRLRSLPSARVSPPKMRARACFITCRTRGAVRPLDPVSDLTGEPLRLTDHPAGRGEQSAVALPKPRLALRSLGACRPRNIEHAQFDAPAAVAKPRADLAGDGGDLLHRPDQHPYAVPEQA